MSNMIKAYTVRYDEVTKITIDTHFRIDRELEEKREHILNVDQTSDQEFVEGIKAVVVEALPSQEETKEKTLKIIEEARKEAEEIIAKAKKEAQQIKNEAFSEAQKKGYEEGAMQVKREAIKQKAELEEMKKGLRREYEDLEAALEPQMAHIIAALVEKMTGILVADREDVIFYLINKTMKNLDKSESYTVKVSQEDYEYVNTRKDILQDAIKDIPLYITADTALTRSQCMIETDVKVINCSLDVQLNNLITDLKLLGGI